MKNLLYIFIGLFAINVNAQSGTNTSYCWNTAKTLTTVWNSTAGGNSNTWDWTSSSPIIVYKEDFMEAGVGSDRGQLVYMPYFCLGAPLGSGSCAQNPNIAEYDLLANLGLAQDIYPADGWELVLKNFGTPNIYDASGQVISHGKGARMPFFMLYNKFTGRVKIFLALKNGTVSADKALIKLEFKSDDDNNKFRALFNNTEAIGYSLQDFSNLRYNQSSNQLVNNIGNGYFWIVAQFQAAYDPCTCLNLNESMLVLSVNALNQQVLSGTISGTSEQVLTTPDSRPSVGSVLGSIVKGDSTFEGYSSKVNSFLDQQNDAKKKKVTEEWYKTHRDDILAQAGTSWESLSLTDRLNLFKNWTESNSDEYKKDLGFDIATNAWGVLGTVSSFVPYAGAVYGLVDGLFGAGDKPTPMTYHTEFKLEATLSDYTQTFYSEFKTPGAALVVNGAEQNLNPIYNNTMGVFGLLKNPSMEYGQLNNVYNTIDFDDALLGHSNDYNAVTNQHIKQYRLQEDIKYIVNPQSEMEVMGIDACFVLEYPNTERLHIRQTEDYADNYAIPYHDLMGKNDMSLTQRIEAIEATGLELEYSTPDLGSMPRSAGDTTNAIIRFRTKYVPLQQLKSINFMLFGGQAPKVYIKMMVSLKHRTNPNIHNVNICTYDISTSVENAVFSGISKDIECHVNATFAGVTLVNPRYYSWSILPSSITTSAPSTSLPFVNPFYTNNADYTTTGGLRPPTTGHITFVSYYNSIPIPLPNNSTYIAYNGFTIPENFQYGQNVTLISGVPVDFPNGNFPPGLTVIINPNIAELLFGADPTRPISVCKATDEEINAICTSNTYITNTAAPNRPAPQVEVPVVVSENNLSAAPNPFNDALVLTMDLVTDSEVSVMAYDMVGHLVENIQVPTSFVAGSHQITWNASNLPAGLYFVTLQGNDFRKTIKVIKQ